MKRLLFSLLAIIALQITGYAQRAASKTYYISPSGNNANPGTSRTLAWKTIDNVNKLILHPRDSVLLEGGQTFAGAIALDSLDGGLPGKPVVISSYGKGMAVIDAGNTNGITCTNCSYVTISGIKVIGSGVASNTSSGILLGATSIIKPCKGIVLDGCVAEGFHNFGILISCGEADAVKGMDSVTISNCVATANGEGGISSIGSQTAFHLTHIRVTHCRAFLNKGIPAKTDGHSGNGIVMSGVKYLLVDSCLAYENGALNNCSAGGPVGIWMWVCQDAVIEHCESHHNHAGLTKDGGGFDIDGGCSNCTIQYNYSHDNEGAGYLLAEYGAGLPFTNNTVRFNISQNDGRKNGYGGIAFWGVSDAFKVTNTYVYNNTVFVNAEKLVNGTPAAVMTMGNQLSHVLVANNVFIATGGARLLNSDTPLDTTVIYFAGNNYYSTGTTKAFNYNNTLLQGVAEWYTANPAQETILGQTVATFTNPCYAQAGAGPLANYKQPLLGLAAYHLQAGKHAPSGICIGKLFGIHVGQHDFFGSPLTSLNRCMVGAVVK